MVSEADRRPSDFARLDGHCPWHLPCGVRGLERNYRGEMSWQLYSWEAHWVWMFGAYKSIGRATVLLFGILYTFHELKDSMNQEEVDDFKRQQGGLSEGFKGTNQRKVYFLKGNHTWNMGHHSWESWWLQDTAVPATLSYRYFTGSCCVMFFVASNFMKRLQQIVLAWVCQLAQFQTLQQLTVTCVCQLGYQWMQLTHNGLPTFTCQLYNTIQPRLGVSCQLI